jgi:ankyrin repeat protein
MYAAHGLSHALHPQSPDDPANPPPPDPDQVRLTTQILATRLPGLLFPFAGASARTREQMGMGFPLHLAGVSDEIADDRVRIEIADLLLAAGAKWDFPAAVAFGKAEAARKMLVADPRLTGAVVYRVITHPESWRQGRRTYDLRGDHHGPWWDDVADGTSVVYPLVAAAARGDTEVVRLLLAYPQPELPFGGSLVMSAFGAAVRAGRAEPMKALTADPANAAAARKDLRWMWTPAARSGSVAVLDVLAGLRKPTDDEVIGALRVAAEAGHLGVVQRLFELRGRPGPNQYSWPLPLAARGGYPHLVRWLLDRGGDPNWTDEAGNTSDRAAAETGHTVCLKLLLDRKPEVDPRGYLGRTPLLAAAAADRVEAFQLLLAAGADRRAVDDDKNTALHLAASSGSLEIVELLLKTGADPAAHNAHGQTPADFAWQKCGFPDAGPPKPQGKVYFRLEAARKK